MHRALFSSAAAAGACAASCVRFNRSGSIAASCRLVARHKSVQAAIANCSEINAMSASSSASPTVNAAIGSTKSCNQPRQLHVSSTCCADTDEADSASAPTSTSVEPTSKQSKVSSPEATAPTSLPPDWPSEWTCCKDHLGSYNEFHEHLLTHVSSMKDDRRCPICVTDVESGVAQAADRPYSSRSARRMAHLAEHLESIHVDVRWPCREETCEKQAATFSTRAALEVHMAREHSGKGRTAPVCDECGSSFSNARTLQVHMHEVHHGVTHACPECGSIFTTAAALVHHRRFIHHEWRYYCSVCGEKSAAYHSYKQCRAHMRSEHAEWFATATKKQLRISLTPGAAWDLPSGRRKADRGTGENTVAGDGDAGTK